LPKTGKHVWIYTGNKLAKFYGNILSLSENIAKSFRGATFLTHTVEILRAILKSQIHGIHESREF